MQSRPPHPLLNLEVGKITPGNCREAIRMGSGTAEPLALGRHGSEVGTGGASRRLCKYDLGSGDAL